MCWNSQGGFVQEVSRSHRLKDEYSGVRKWTRGPHGVDKEPPAGGKCLCQGGS
jgi:hypothetical protein